MTEGAAAAIRFGTLSNTSDPLLPFLPLHSCLLQDQGSRMFFCHAKQLHAKERRSTQSPGSAIKNPVVKQAEK